MCATKSWCPVVAETITPDGLLDAFWAYESALMANDLPALDRLFSDGPATLRGDGDGLLVGHDAISSFRAGRGGAPQRRILRVEVRATSTNAAVVVAIFTPESGGRGQQTQLWTRAAHGAPWTVDVAHVSQPAPAVNASIWRTVGTPLIQGSDVGVLEGETVAVKDLFEIAGFRVGAGVPAYFAEQVESATTASAVAALLAEGADVRGIAQTDEFAYSIAGRNAHYGTPPNTAVVGGIPGGSSSGPASAVATGQATIGLGTDTGGSIRVPASYQGLWGLRTTYGAVPTDGLLPLSPSFDTIGWLTRSPELLESVARVGLDATLQVSAEATFAIAPALVARTEAAVASAFSSWAWELEAVAIDLGDLDELAETFRTIQAAEAWRTHGVWIAAHPGALSLDIAARFEWASRITADHENRARATRAALGPRIASALEGRILLLPSASSVAPSTTATTSEVEAARAATLGLTCVAGLLGAPAVSAPLLEVDGAPVGVCLVGPQYSDVALTGIAKELAPRAFHF